MRRRAGPSCGNIEKRAAMWEVRALFYQQPPSNTSVGVAMESSSFLADIESFFRAISPIAVIAGTVLVVLQLRLNAKQARSRNAFDLIGKVVDPSFPARRHMLYEVSKKHANGSWDGFYRSREDFEVRNFASVYEQLGLLVKKGVIDVHDVMDALSVQPMADWHMFAPIRKHIMEQTGKVFPALAINLPGIESIYWPNFKWLAEENENWLRQRMPVKLDDGAQ
jgi:hypothetical protein